MNLKSMLNITGLVTITEVIIDNNRLFFGDIIQKRNIVVGTGRALITRMLTGLDNLYLKYIALGDLKNSAPSITDFKLEREIKRILINQNVDVTFPTQGSLKFVKIISGDEFPSTTTIKDGGLVFSDGTIAFNSGTLFNRVAFIDNDPETGITFQPTNEYGVSIGKKIEFEIQL